MKKLLLLLSLFVVFCAFLFLGVTALPYYYYKKALKNDVSHEWFKLDHYEEYYLKPSRPVDIEPYIVANQSLWKQFHLMDVLVPLPVKNPFYYVTTDLRFDKESKKTLVGLVFYGTGQREITKIFFSENKNMPNILDKHGVFRLPLIQDRLFKLDDDKVWEDLFTKDISDWNVKFSQMSYRLYLLEMRANILPRNTKNYFMIKGTQTAVVEIESKNKDYKHELVLTRSRGFIYSYLLVTRIKDLESQKLRRKLLTSIKFRGGSEYLAPIIYKEFKALEYRDKIDHIGMLYLLSAFTHNLSNSRFIEDMVFYLERGSKNERQLAPLYKYANTRYGKTFATKIIKGIKIDNDLILKRALELEETRKNKSLEASRVDGNSSRHRTTKQIRRERLDSAKKSIKKKKSRMLID